MVTGTTVHLLVNNLNAPFPFSSMAWKLATGSSNLAQQRSANFSAVSLQSAMVSPLAASAEA